MKIFLGILLLSLSVLDLAAANRDRRGVVEEVGKLFDGFQAGIDHFQRTTREEVSKLRPWAETLEREMHPAMARVEEELGSAFERIGQTFSDIDRNDQDHHYMDTSGMPGLGNMFGQALNPFELFGFTRRNWWEGRNVCVERKVINDNDEPEEASAEDIAEAERTQQTRRSKFFAMDMSFTSCRDDHNYHECTTQISRNGAKKQVSVRYQCCYGFERSNDGQPGCTEMIMENLETTVKNIGTTEFYELLESSGIKSELDNNVTVFVPSNDAVEDFRHELQQINTLDSVSYNVDDGFSYRKKRDITIVETPALDEILKAHIVPGFIDTADVRDEDVLESVNNHNIRMTVYNTYPQRAVMANCAKVTSRDHYSTNGVVHVIDKVIMPATKTLREMVETDVQFSFLKDVLTKTNLMDQLEQPGQWTLFAPTNAAFEKMDKDMRAKIEKGNGCSKDILLNHLLPNVICTGVIENKAKTVNALDKFVILERNGDDELLIEQARVVTRDIMGTNGVIHAIDTVLIPETARDITEALDESHMTTFKELFEIAGLDKDDEMNNVTIFAPSERALATLPSSVLDDLKADPAKLKEFLLFHVAKPKTCQCDFEDNKVLKTALDNNNAKLRINTYDDNILRPLIAGLDQNAKIPKHGKVTVQCARLTSLDKEVCGGMIHVVDKVLMPPIGNVMDVVKLDNKHSTWMELVKLAGMEQELNDATGPYTVLAPTNGAFDNMADELRKEIFADQEIAAQVVKHHVLREMVCCTGISRNFMFFDQSTKFTLLEDDVVNVRKSAGGYLYADRAELTTCDMVANNGVVHAIDRVLLPIGIGPQRPTERRSMYHHNYRFNPMDLFKLGQN